MIHKLRRERIGVARVVLPPANEAEEAPDDPFREALLRIKRESGFYRETTDGVTFVTPTLYRASILLPAEAQTGDYEVAVKLFADGP